MSEEIYVIVADNDRPHSRYGLRADWVDPGGSIVFEQYVKDADLDNIKRRCENLSPIYGRCRIARLEFIDDQPDPHANTPCGYECHDHEGIGIIPEDGCPVHDKAEEVES